jgi:hypothetical protein
LWRLYRAGGNHPSDWRSFRRFGPVATARFDHHEPPPHDDEDGAILYAALAAPTAVVEAFQDHRLIDRIGRRPWLVAFRLVRGIRLLDLRSDWPTRAGASQAISTGRRDVARTWSRAIYDEFDGDGLIYPSAFASGEESIALYERAAAALPPAPDLHLPLDHPGLEAPLSRVAVRYGYTIR